MRINNREIDSWGNPYIIAEISGNHNGDISRAIRIIEAAKSAGADAVKLQAYTPDTITIDHDGPGFVLRDGPWKGRKLYDLYREAHTPWDWFPRLFGEARVRGIDCFSSVFDKSSVDMLERLNPCAYKIASFEIVDIPLLRYVASKHRPMILSTGMADHEEINRADDTLHDAGVDHTFLHCVSGYPTPIEQANLGRIEELRGSMVLPIGLSDHSPGTEIAIAATALGTSIIEKHLTLSRQDGGPDAEFSMEPHEFKDMVSKVRAVHKAMCKTNPDSEKPQKNIRKSLYVIRDIEAGEPVSEGNVASIRPGYGLPPRFWDLVVGRRAKHSISRGTPLSLGHLLEQ